MNYLPYKIINIINLITIATCYHNYKVNYTEYKVRSKNKLILAT